MARVIYSRASDARAIADSHQETFARDVMSGLSARRKFIPAAYHYDAEGSRLFNRITELPEYYLTRCEINALERNREKIADLLSDGPINLIEFGPGDGGKTRSMISFFIQQKIDFRYVAVDISPAALENLAEDYQSCFSQLSVDCLVANYITNLKWLSEHYRQKNLILFLGSSIGNFSPEQTRLFLLNLWHDLNDGDMIMIGFDLVKKAELIHKAYNDSEGITAAFNLNVLKRINRELDGDFVTSKFRYVGKYNAVAHVVRSYLISLEDHDARVGALERSFRFCRGELIHTEDSYKYRESDIENLAARYGFSVQAHLYDSQKYFVDSVWKVEKG